MSDYAQLKNAAKRYEKMMRENLNNILRVGDRHAGWIGGLDRAGDLGGTSNPRQRAMGGLNFRYGQTPNEHQFQQWLKAQGGNPYMRAITAIPTTRSGRVQKTVDPVLVSRLKMDAVTQEKSVLERFLEEGQAKIGEANAANEARYQEILTNLNGLYDRTMARVENWGKAAETQLKRSAKESFGSQEATLSARGLGNSTIVNSFKQRNATDLAERLQALSEQKDARAAQYDTALTGDIAQFMERRTDKAPDYGQLLQLAQQYGLGGDGRGFNQGADGQPQDPSQGQYQPRDPDSFGIPVGNRGGGGGGGGGFVAPPIFLGNPFGGAGPLVNYQGGGRMGIQYTPRDRTPIDQQDEQIRGGVRHQESLRPDTMYGLPEERGFDLDYAGIGNALGFNSGPPQYQPDMGTMYGAPGGFDPMLDSAPPRSAPAFNARRKTKSADPWLDVLDEMYGPAG